MPDPITFGDILIHDRNDNNLYDAKFDLVTNLEHQEIPHEKKQKLQEILKQLNKPTWKGIILNPTGAYFTAFFEAKKHAEEGEPDDVKTQLTTAKEIADQIKLKFNEKAATEILKKAYLKGIEKCRKIIQHPTFNNQFLPMAGNLEEVQAALLSLERYTHEYNQTFNAKLIFDKAEAEAILKKSYLAEIPALAAEVTKYAQFGSILFTKILLKSMTKHIDEAKRKFQLDFPYDTAWADQQLQEALIKGIPHEWAKAKQEAAKGQTILVRKILNRIQSLVLEGNRKFGLGLNYDQQKEDEIMEEALREGAEDNFRLAEKFARQANLTKTQHWIDQAHQYLQEYNVKYSHVGKGKIFFDHDRAEKIIKCAKGLGGCP